MSNKKKKSRGWVLLACVLGLGMLIGLYVMLPKLTSPDLPAETTETKTETYSLSSYNLMDMISFRYRSEQAELSFVRDTFADPWRCEQDPSFPLNQELMNGMAETIAGLYSNRKVGEDNGEYGLENPKVLFEAEYANGQKEIFAIGIENSFTGLSYLKKDGVVYTVSSTLATIFSQPLSLLIGLDTFPETLTEDALTQMELSFRGCNRTITDWDGMLELHDATVKRLPLTDWADAYVEEEEEGLYGLDEPYAVLTIGYTAKITESPEAGEVTRSLSYTIRFGNAIEKDGKMYRYFLVGDSRILYEAEESLVADIVSYIDYVPAETTEIKVNPTPLSE